MPFHAADASPCDPSNGNCICKPGVGGAYCDRCMVGYWGFHDYGCRPCDCAGDCDPFTGDCMFGYNRKTDFILIASGHYANIMLALAYASRLCDYDVNVQCVCVFSQLWPGAVQLGGQLQWASEDLQNFWTLLCPALLRWWIKGSVHVCVCVLFTLIFLHILLTKL